MHLSPNSLDIVVFGVVQGVGFRPFIFRTARALGYTGWVKNVGLGVEVHLESARPTDFADFLQALDRDKPPLSQIEKTDVRPGDYTGCGEFTIQKTRGGESFVFISPDISICDNCRREMFAPEDRRYHYPFINCTDCGPRYTIVDALPYDRDQTTMRAFAMCDDCRREYEDPMDRRYHAQPVACPRCGPRIRLLDAKTREIIHGGECEAGARKRILSGVAEDEAQESISDTVHEASALIQSGKILAVKGLGGFHLVCDPLNAEAVARLRTIKARKTKPLALMARDIEVVERHAHVSPDEREQLTSPRRPIVLLRQKGGLPGIAPHLTELGFMLPYTPLHYLLLHDDLDLIVATSSNLKDSPIMKTEEEGIYTLCDAILTHDRPIAMRADDSVMKLSSGRPLFVRRARGYVPYPQAVPEGLRIEGHILALGGELKDTVSVYKNGYVVTSQFMGDLDEYQNTIYFEETIRHLCSLFKIKPEAVVSDLHPDFHTTRHAQRMGLPHLQVQHHFAHVLAVMLEHGVPPGTRVLGISWDGFGYGEDGTPWGAEFLAAGYGGFERLGHFRYMGLPGGDLAARQPWRMALSYLADVYGEELPRVKALDRVEPHLIKGVREMLRQGLNTPEVSSCGRLFDAVSFLAGLAPLQVEYEAEAPMRLEAAADPACIESYPFQITRGAGNTNHGDMKKSPAKNDNPQKLPYTVSFAETIKGIVADAAGGAAASLISARFHNTLAGVIAAAAHRAREEQGLDIVVLSGGVFLNRTLLEKAEAQLIEDGFRVLRPLLYSPNDESISVGQIAFALHHLQNNGLKNKS
ncbi:MAG: carbamoyltransferase HypF [Candidatus Aminicenantaceae bacterium]